jgi:hypothetical protein
MNCTGCGRTNPAGARFCAGCGQPLAPRCPACGAEHEGDARFCVGCGAALPTRPEPVPGRVEGPRPGPSSERAEVRKVVTIVFADLRLKELEREKRELKRANEISCTNPQRVTKAGTVCSARQL